jgi:hypothetical protein
MALGAGSVLDSICHCDNNPVFCLAISYSRGYFNTMNHQQNLLIVGLFLGAILASTIGLIAYYLTK